ncbi:MAG TPA: aquaporin [Candidatus Dormibacteraeota bacterium]
MTALKPRAYVAEFVGTFALIFVGVGSIAMDAITHGKVGVTGVALAHGLTIAVFASATAAVSGGHLNPAVTFAAWVGRQIDAANALGYWIAQVLGAVAAAALLHAVIPAGVLTAVDVGTPAPGGGVTGTQALLIEAVLTFFLVFVIFGTAIDARAPKVGALFIGLTVSLDIFMGGPLTGAAMNPARWLGPALVGGGGLGNWWIYSLGPLTGATAAALVYTLAIMEGVTPAARPFPLGPSRPAPGETASLEERA